MLKYHMSSIWNIAIDRKSWETKVTISNQYDMAFSSILHKNLLNTIVADSFFICIGKLQHLYPVTYNENIRLSKMMISQVN